MPSADATLAPSGTLRAAINCGNAVLAHRDAATGKLSGVTVDLAQEMARRLGVALELVAYDGAGNVVDAASGGAWDIAFLAIDPQRAKEIAYTSPYVLIEGAFLVRAQSSFDSPASLDRPGVRIAVASGAAYELHLARVLEHAELVRYPTSADVLPGMLADGLEAGAGIRQPVAAFAADTPGVRVLAEAFMQIRQAVAVPLQRAPGIAWLEQQLVELSRSGLIAESLARAGQDPGLANRLG